jgi:putative peptidoglycan lipid II flippase
MSRMLKSSGAMGAATLTSRVLGLVREMVYSRFMGTGWVASAFVLAFQVPNLFRRLLGEGALTAAFIPIFKQKEKLEGDAEMWRAANAVISGLVVVAAVITGLAMLVISLVLAIGSFEAKTRLMLELLRIMFPYMLLVCLTAVLIGMANARGHFFVPALGAAMLNVVMIASVLFLAPQVGLELPKELRLPKQIFALAYGVLLAGVAQAAFQLPSLRREGYRYHWVSPWRNATVREVVRKMLPGSIGVAAFQINVLITQSFSFWFDTSIVATFNYAVRLMELPQGMFGISLATYLLPALAGLAAEKKYPEFRETLGQAVGYLTFVNLVAAAVSLALAEPIVRLLFEGGAFGPDATQRVALALSCLAPGLLLFSMVNILARAFYALNDVQTPMKISVVCLGLNLIFALWLIQPYREAGLGIANTLSAAFNVWLLMHALRRKLSRLEWTGLRRTLLTMLATAVLTGEVTWFASQYWEQAVGHRGMPGKFGAVFVPMALAGVLYLSLNLWLKIPAARDILGLLRRRFDSARE